MQAEASRIVLDDNPSNPVRKVPGPYETAGMYDLASADWDRATRRIGADTAYARLFADLLCPPVRSLGNLPDRPTVLDCGIGTGRFVYALAEVHPALRIHGIDLSAGMLAQARSRLASAEMPARLARGDARALPYPDASFDLVLCAHMLEHLADPWRAVHDMERVLRPGGAVVIVITGNRFADAVLRRRWRYAPIRPRALCGWLHSVGFTEVDRHSFGRFGELAGWLGDAWAGHTKPEVTS